MNEPLPPDRRSWPPSPGLSKALQMHLVVRLSGPWDSFSFSSTNQGPHFRSWVSSRTKARPHALLCSFTAINPNSTLRSAFSTSCYQSRRTAEQTSCWSAQLTGVESRTDGGVVDERVDKNLGVALEPLVQEQWQISEMQAKGGQGRGTGEGGGMGKGAAVCRGLQYQPSPSLASKEPLVFTLEARDGGPGGR